MTPDPALLVLDDSSAKEGVRSATLQLPDGAHESLTFRAIEGRLDPRTAADPFLLGLLLIAMKHGHDVHVQGRVSARCLRNINELQRMWNTWQPREYSLISITADGIREDLDPAEQAGLAAFSGGVDSYFTLGGLGAHGDDTPRTGALFVHGFDIPLSKPDVFASARARAQTVLDMYKVDSLAVSSNIRELDVPWEHVHGLAIASCMALWAGTYSIGYVGSGKAYDELILPWGSSPVSDHLFGTGGMEIWHDGAAFSRTEKIARLVRSDMPLEGLRVCYRGTAGDQNCGRCEKCVRTYFSFCAAGDTSPSCFVTPPTRLQRCFVVVRSRRQLAEIESVQRYANDNDSRGPWRADLRMAIVFNKLILPVTGRAWFWQSARAVRSLVRTRRQ